MKNIIIILFLIVNTTISLAQSPAELLKERREKLAREMREYNEGLVDTSHRYFYKTYDDYLTKNHVQGVKYTGKRKIVFDTESVLVLENDDFTYRKIKELKYWGFIDEWGQLERIFNNHCYFVLDTGKICLYVKAIDVDMTTDKNGNVKLNPVSEGAKDYKDYISEGLNGDITDFNDKKIQSLTASQPEVFEQYKSEAIDYKKKDTRNQKTFKIQKYVSMYNRKQ